MSELKYRDSNASRNWVERPVTRILVFGLIFLIYVINRSPFVSFHDSLSYLADAMEGFQLGTNATNHFLYNNIQHLLVEIFFFVDPVFVLSLFSVFCSMAVLILLEYWIREMTGNAIFGLLGTVIMALSFTWWQQTEIIEVYTFNSLVYLAYVVPAFLDLRDGHRGRGIRVAVFFGLALLTHVQHILSFPFLLYYVFTSKENALRKVAIVALPILIFSTLFLIRHFNPTNTVSAIFFDSQFQSNVMGFDIMEIGLGIIKSFAFLIYNYHIWLVFLLGGTIHLLQNQDRKMIWPLVILSLPYFGFGAKYNVDDNHVFFLLAWFPFVVIMTYGMERWKFVIRKATPLLLPLAFVLPIIGYGLTAKICEDLDSFQDYRVHKEYKGGVSHIFWPGKMKANDPLEMAKAWQAKGQDVDSIPEWNFCVAVSVLEMKGEWQGEKPTECR